MYTEQVAQVQLTMGLLHLRYPMYRAAYYGTAGEKTKNHASAPSSREPSPRSFPAIGLPNYGTARGQPGSCQHSSSQAAQAQSYKRLPYLSFKYKNWNPSSRLTTKLHISFRYFVFCKISRGITSHPAARGQSRPYHGLSGAKAISYSTRRKAPNSKMIKGP